MLDTRQLRYFVAIHDYGSLNRAAAEVRVAASALSHQLGQLEAQLGTPLFRRKPRGMEPTAAGLRLYDHARSILKAIEAAQSDLKAANRRIAGQVAVGMSYSGVKAIGVELLSIVLRDYPEVRLVLSESLSGAALPLLRASDVDMALIYNPPAEAGLRSRPVLEESMVCIGLPGVIGDTDAPIAFADLLDLPIILVRQGISARAIMDDVALLKKIEARAILQMNSIQAIGGAVEAGLGCIIGTRLFMQEQIDRGTVRARPIVSPALSRTLYLCDLAARPPSYATEAICDLILELVRRAVREGRWSARLI